MILTVNKLIAELKKLKKEGHGDVEVHMLAHDNCVGESQGGVYSLSYFEKGSDRDRPEGRDEDLYNSIPEEVVYLHN